MSHHRHDYRGEYPPYRRQHSPTCSDYSTGPSEYSPTRDAGAVRVSHRHHDPRDRRALAEGYDVDRYRPRAEQEYFYEERRPRSLQRSDVYVNDSRHHHSRSHHDSHRKSSKRRHSVSDTNWSQAAFAAASAGIIEAGLARHDRNKTARVLTAAAGAGAIDIILSKDHEKPHRKWENVIGSTVGGVAIDRVANGSRRRH
ncbi:hypothetical protein LZ32DRAFT_605979 [Colletotrichum eremochloae]|nr:hypothetical protein LZ32DRAFT_605979 [Colletotrichum eremochloae]